MNTSMTFGALKGAARDPAEIVAQVLAGGLIRFTLHGVTPPTAASRVVATSTTSVLDETEDILQLLLEHRSDDGEETLGLAHAMASACRGANHLYQDMGLAHRSLLSDLLRRHFTTLHAKNTSNMKWKKFFYKQLCERAEINVCRAPTCAECSDYSACFEPE